MKSRILSRRAFAKNLGLVPLGLVPLGLPTGASALEPQDETKLKPAIKPALKNDPWHIHEPEPFEEPLRFTRLPMRPRIEPFALDEVTLHPGPLQEARDWNRGYILRLDNDRLLHNFRVTAGLHSEATPLGGWESPDTELRGHFVGHYLSACALLYAATRDEAIKAKGDALVMGIADCQTKLNRAGYVSAFPEELFTRLDADGKVWAPFYTLHKIMAGLLAMSVYAGNLQALEVLLKLAGWVDGWTEAKSEEHMQQILKTEFGGMNDVLYELAAVTGDDRWARTGDRFTNKQFFTPLALRKDELKHLHANTHMPQVIGAARRFELSSDARFGNVAEFFYETVTEARTYATGGSGNNEFWLTQPDRLALEAANGTHHQECCCAYNMMKLTRHLFGWKGDTHFIDYYERNLLNHRLGAIEPETGLTTYFLSMTPAAWKTLCTEDETFWCCTGTAVEEYAKLNDTIYFHDAEALYVNLFVASELHWKAKGVRLQQETRFPEDGRTTLTVHASPTAAWTMRLRTPAWTTDSNSVAINGKRLDVAGTPGSYLTITRVWKAGDRMEITLPMRLTAEKLRDDPTQQAFLYGPLVLAGQFPRAGLKDDLQHRQGPDVGEAPAIEVPALVARGSGLEDWIKPVAGQPLTFQTTGQAHNISLKPLNRSWDRFAVYWTVS